MILPVFPLKVWKPNRYTWIELRALFYRRPWSILSWASGLMAISFIVYYGLQAATSPQVGAQFVLAEWPSPKISPFFYAKPITWFSYFGFLYWAFGLESNKQRLTNLSQRWRRFAFITTAFVAFGAFYEIFFNFMLWSAFEVLSNACTNQPCNPDVLANNFPALTNPVNLVFATKVVTMVFGLATYSLWFLHRVEKDAEKRREVSDSVLSHQVPYGVTPMATARINKPTDLDPDKTPRTVLTKPGDS